MYYQKKCLFTYLAIIPILYQLGVFSLLYSQKKDLLKIFMR